MIVDVHAHAISEQFLADLQRRPIAGISADRGDDGTYFMRGGGWDRPSSLDANLHDLPRRLASLKRREVELQLFAPPPGFFSWAGGAAGREWVQALHAQELDIAAQAQGLMEPMAVFALGEPEHAVDEIRRAMDLYPFRAGMLPSTAGGRPLDDPIFEPMWSLIEELGLLIFLHPTSAVGSERFGLHGVHVLVGWPFETTLAVTRLIFEGVLERHPGLRSFFRTEVEISFFCAVGSIRPTTRRDGRRTPTTVRTSAAPRVRIWIGSITIHAHSASKAIVSWSRRWVKTGSCSGAITPSISEIPKANAQSR